MFRNQRRGIAKSLIEMYRHVRQLRPDWEILAYHRRAESDSIRAQIDDLSHSLGLIPRPIEMVGDRFDWWQRYRLPLAAWADGVDALHCPANQFPSCTPVPVISTIHDLIPLDLPAGYDVATIRQFEKSVRSSCQHAAAIVTVSNHTRSRLIDRYGVDAQRINVVPWAADVSLTHIDEIERQQVRQKFNLKQRTVLHYGSREPRKNTARLIDAWHALALSHRAGWQLCIVGLDESGKQYFTNRCQQHVQKTGEADDIQLHGYLDDADANALLCEAQVLAYPSLSEGFGLPILDAFAARTAVLTSQVTSLPEVAGHAALLIDPTETMAITVGLNQLMTDDHTRNEYIRHGTAQLLTRTWKNTAQKFIDVMESTIPGRAMTTTTQSTTTNPQLPELPQRRAA